MTNNKADNVTSASRFLKEGVLRSTLRMRATFGVIAVASVVLLLLYGYWFSQDQQLSMIAIGVALFILCFLGFAPVWIVRLPDSALEAVHDNASIPIALKLELAEHLAKHGTVTLQQLERIERKHTAFTVQGVGAQKLMSLREKGA